MVGRKHFDHRRGWRILAFALLILPGPILAAVSAEVDKNPVLEGESLTLTVTVTDGTGGEPNFAVLEPEFRILDRGQSSQFRIMNGQTSRQTQFTVTLLPQRRGEIAIPSIVVGSERTRPIMLKVQRAEPGGDNAPAAFIQFEADKERVHVREQVLLTARLYVRGQLVSGNLSEPEADGAVVESLGEQTEHQELRGRHRYRVIERRYALFPEQSGRLNLQAPVFAGEITDGGAPRPSLFGMRRQTRRIHASGEPLNLSVEPRPADYPGDVWLPAGNVQLRQQIEPEDGPWVAGEPLTRTVIIEVDGQLHTQLPELTLPGPTGAPSYAEAPVQQTAGNARGVTAVSRHPMAIIPAAAGELTLPEIRITWWDVAADRPREAVLEARTLPIQAAAGATPAPTPAATPPGTAPAATTTPDASKRLWQILAITALAGWLGTLAAWWWHSRPRRKHRPVAIDDQGPLLATLRRAEPGRCRQALLRFAAKTLDGNASLNALAERADDPAFTRALESLDGALYGAETGEWPRADREAVIRRIRAWPRREKTARRHELPPLYPD